MSRDLLIDGYNLMHAAGLARARYGPGDLERCRRSLLRLIAGQLSIDQRRCTTIVFDGKEAPPQADRLDNHAEMLVLYSDPDEEADDLIERLIACHSAPRQLAVVSSDHRLQKAARRRRATPLDSDEFLDECARRAYSAPPVEAPQPKPDCDASPDEMAAWLEAFDVDPREIDADVPAAPAQPRPPPGRQMPQREAPADPEPLHDELAFWEARIADLFRRRPDEFSDGT